MPDEIRTSTAGDFEQFYGRPAPPIWMGRTVARNGKVVGMGAIIWDEEGRALGAFDQTEPLSRFLIHRTLLEMIRILKEVGEPVLYVARDDSIPGSERWLKRAGFSPVPDHPQAWHIKLGVEA